MMLSIREYKIGVTCARLTISYFLVITVLLKSKDGQSLRIVSRSVSQQPLGLQQHVTTLPYRLQLQKCRALHQCGDMDANHLTARGYYDLPTSGTRNVDYETFSVTIKPYVTRKYSNENIFYHSTMTTYTKRSNVVTEFPVRDGGSLTSTPTYDVAPNALRSLSKLKQIVENKKKKIVSRIINKHFYDKYSTPAPNDYEIDSTSVNAITIDISQEYKSKYETNVHRKKLLLNDFKKGLDKLERKFYMVTFTKLINMTAGGPRAENAISFVQSGLFLQLLLLALSVERDPDVKSKIDNCIGIHRNISNAERIQLIDDVMSTLPSATHGLVFHWSSHLVMGPKYSVSEEFKKGAAAALRLHLGQFNGTETPEMLSAFLNRMVEDDSKGAIHNTFEPGDLSGTVSAVFLTTLYLRSRWRTAPTVLNGSRIFRDFFEDPDRTIRMIRINDMMRYAKLTDCDAEALEVFYGKPGLSLLILVPKASSLRRLAAYVSEVGLISITAGMKPVRVAADLPLYTLRMSLLLPNKIEGLGLSELLKTDTDTDSILKMSHGLQRLMFWAEAGRTAFKDDGIEWDEPPDMKIVINRPYLFFVRWQNMTLMNGNFVL